MSNFLCRLGFHFPDAETVENAGLEFGCCRACGEDMIHDGRGWSLVPRGYRIVWKATVGLKPARLTDTDGAGGVEAARGGGRVAPDRVPPKRAPSRTPRLTFLDLAIGGLAVLVWYASDQLRDWRQANALRLRANKPVPRLQYFPTATG